MLGRVLTHSGRAVGTHRRGGGAAQKGPRCPRKGRKKSTSQQEEERSILTLFKAPGGQVTSGPQNCGADTKQMQVQSGPHGLHGGARTQEKGARD